MSKRSTLPGKSDLVLLKDPEELLHKYLLLKDENALLKKHNSEQEEKIKKPQEAVCAPRCSQAAQHDGDRYDEDTGPQTKGPKVRDYQAEEKIAQLEQELREWKLRCEQLKNKNEYLAQLIPATKGGRSKTTTRRPTDYTQPMIYPRRGYGFTHRSLVLRIRPSTASRVSRAPPPPAHTAVTAPVSASDVDAEFPVHHMQSTQLLRSGAPQDMQGLMAENTTLMMQILQLQTELATHKKQAENWADKVAEAQEKAQVAEAQVDKMSTAVGQRPPGGSQGRSSVKSIYTDEDYTALQREMREKFVDLAQANSKYQNIEVRFEALAANEQRLLKEVENKTSELKSERNKNLELGKQVASLNLKAQQTDAYRTQLELEQKSRESAEEQVNKIMKRVFKIDANAGNEVAKVKVQKDQQKRYHAAARLGMHVLRRQVRYMTKALLHVWHRLAVADTLGVQAQKMLDQAMVDMGKKDQELKLLKHDGQIDTNVFQELLGGGGSKDDRNEKKLKRELDESRNSYKELMKDMQRMQEIMKTHNDMKDVWEGEKKQLHEEKAELEADLKSAKLRKKDVDDMRSSNAAKTAEDVVRLEKQVAQLKQDLTAANQIAKQAEAARETAEARAAAGGGPSVGPSPEKVQQIKPSDFEAGKNVMELSLMSASLRLDAMDELGLTEHLSSFLLIDFASHQPTTTKLVQGLSPAYDLDVEFSVEVNAFFLELLATEPIIVEMYVRGGTTIADASTPVAVARIYLVDLLKRPDKRILSSVDLMTSSGPGLVARSIGTMQFSVGLRTSIAEVAEKFRKIASGALQSTLSRTGGAFSAANPNEARVKIGVHVVSCSNLRLLPNGARPSPVVAYQFFNFPPCDTEAVIDTLEPRFDDVRYYEMARDAHLKTYLKGSELDVAVFDDSGVAADAMLGTAAVRLEPLLHKEEVLEQYDLLDSKGNPSGKVSLRLFWVRPDAPTGNYFIPNFDAQRQQQPQGPSAQQSGHSWYEPTASSHSRSGFGSGQGGSALDFEKGGTLSDSRGAFGRGSGAGSRVIDMEGSMMRSSLKASMLGSCAELDVTGDLAEWGLDSTTEWGQSSALSPPEHSLWSPVRPVSRGGVNAREFGGPTEGSRSSFGFGAGGGRLSFTSLEMEGELRDASR